jgi:hypothetical protein
MGRSRIRNGTIIEVGRSLIRCGDSSDPRVRAWLYAGSGMPCTIVDPPYEMAVRHWLPFVTDPSIVFGTASMCCRIPPHLFRFARIMRKSTVHRIATTQIRQCTLLVMQVGSEKRLPRNKRACYPCLVDHQVDPARRQRKPLGLLVEHLTTWTGRHDYLVDPYGGSLVTHQAADQLQLQYDRHGRGPP